MWFWKAFAWIALGWALVMRRGAGILLKKSPANKRAGAAEAEASERKSGSRWPS